MRHMNGLRCCATLVLALLGGTACRDKQPPREYVIVFAAASLDESLRAIEKAYEDQNPQIDVVINFAGSQLLATQLLEGAAADVFASADAATLDRVVANRPAVPETRRVFATNKLVFVVPSNSPAQSFDQVDELLAQPSTRAVLAAPEVPVGRYARQALDQLGLRDLFESKLVSNEDSVDGVLAKLELGECDLGIAYMTDIRRSENLRGISLPDNIDITTRYELAVLADGPNSEQGQIFVNYVTGPEGLATLQDYGFGKP
jgi:molybdate transport system substrate-binding protein